MQHPPEKIGVLMEASPGNTAFISKHRIMVVLVATYLTTPPSNGHATPASTCNASAHFALGSQAQGTADSNIIRAKGVAAAAELEAEGTSSHGRYYAVIFMPPSWFCMDIV